MLLRSAFIPSVNPFSFLAVASGEIFNKGSSAETALQNEQ